MARSVPGSYLKLAVGWLPLCLVAATILVRFLPAPWQLDVIIDEMLHLESWRNRYDEPLISPLVMEKLHATGRLSDPQYEQFRQFMLDHHWLQRVVLSQFVDAFPPIYTWLVEGIAAFSDSSLLAMRIPSVLGALLALWSLHRLGRELAGPALAWWLVAFAAISYLTQLYAGIGRAYALGQGTLALALLQYVRWSRHPEESSASFLGCALLSQSMTWFAWPLLLPPILHVALQTVLVTPTPVTALFRRFRWYALGSLSLMPFLGLQMLNPSMRAVAVFDLNLIWSAFAHASPFGHLLGLGNPIAALGAVALLALVIVGTRELLRGDILGRGAAWSLATSSLGGALSFALWRAGDRRMMCWMLVVGILAGVGAWRACGREGWPSQAAVSVLLAGFLFLSLKAPVDPYLSTLDTDTDYSAAAGVLRQQIGPSDRWATYPYFISNPLYPYGNFPEPIWPMTEDEFLKVMQRERGERPLFVWLSKSVGVASQYTMVEAASDARWDFRNGYTIFRLPAKATNASAVAPGPQP